jgi:hypothetical protein
MKRLLRLHDRFIRLRWALLTVAVVVSVWVMPERWVGIIADDWLIPACFWLGIAFIVLYTFLSAWWGNQMGRLIVGLDVALILIVVEPTFQIEFGVHFGTSLELRILFAALIVAPLTILSRTVLLGRLHHWRLELPWRHKRDAGE